MAPIIINWLYVLVALGIAVTANYIGATWAAKENWLTWWLLLICLVSPFVFITFGLVTARVGVAIGSGTLDALLTISTVIMGLIIFHEWDKISLYQSIGLGFVVLGIILLQFTGKAEV